MIVKDVVFWCADCSNCIDTLYSSWVGSKGPCKARGEDSRKLPWTRSSFSLSHNVRMNIVFPHPVAPITMILRFEAGSFRNLDMEKRAELAETTRREGKWEMDDGKRDETVTGSKQIVNHKCPFAAVLLTNLIYGINRFVFIRSAISSSDDSCKQKWQFKSQKGAFYCLCYDFQCSNYVSGVNVVSI